MPWWVQAGLDWFPAVIMGLIGGYVLELPIGATLLLILIIAGITRVLIRLWQRMRAGPM
jgi:hypothetical protein